MRSICRGRAMWWRRGSRQDSGRSTSACGAAYVRKCLRAMRATARNRPLVLGLQAIILVAVVLVWEIGTALPTGPNRVLIDPFIWSRPSSILGRVGQWMQSGIILNNVFITLYEAFMSFLLGALAGII